MTKTLATSLTESLVDFSILKKRYRPVLEIVKLLIGVIPNCDRILEIWPTAFRTYNLLVPNLLGLPKSLFANQFLKDSLSLAIYSSSRASGCAYCTAHTCSFALRRGMKFESVKGAFAPNQKSIVSIAAGLSLQKAHISNDEMSQFFSYFDANEREFLVLSIGLMGFLNKFMDAMGVELEDDSAKEVGQILASTGWTPGKHLRNGFDLSISKLPKPDSLVTYLKILLNAPSALLLEKRWMTLVSMGQTSAWSELNYFDSLLKKITYKKNAMVLKAVLIDNMNATRTTTGLLGKYLAGYVYSKVVSNAALAKQMMQLTITTSPTISLELFESLDKIVDQPTPISTNDCSSLISHLCYYETIGFSEEVIILLARCASTSPSIISEDVISLVGRRMSPSQIVEIISWISLLQLFHRIDYYYLSVQNYHLDSMTKT